LLGILGVLGGLSACGGGDGQTQGDSATDSALEGADEGAQTDGVSLEDSLGAADTAASGPDSDLGADVGAIEDSGDGGGGTAWACDSPGEAVEPAPRPAVWFEKATLGQEVSDASIGFGRAMVVDLDGDGIDDLVAMPAHDGQHPVPPDNGAKLVLRGLGDGGFAVWSGTGLEACDAGLLLWGDIDNDGDQDAWAGSIDGKGQGSLGVWWNDGTGKFAHAGAKGTAPQTLACGEYTCLPQNMAGSLADLDGDGLLDLYVGGWFWSDGVTDTRYNPPARDRLYRGAGQGDFVDFTASLGVQGHPLTNSGPNLGRAAMGVAVSDYDNDADLDVFVANYGAGRPKGPFADQWLCQQPRYWDQELLWRNQGGLAFTNEADAAGVAATMRGPGDVQNEPPLVMGPECPAGVQGEYPSPISGNSFTPDWGDFDNDGDMDLIVGAIAHPDYLQADRTLLFVNQGAPSWRFAEESLERGLVWREDEKHATFVDVDLDGRLDIATTGFRQAGDNDLRIYQQTPAGAFVRVSADVLGISDAHQESAVWLDVDQDGDLDVWIAEDDGPAQLFLNRVGDVAPVVVLRLEGGSPRDATGARVYAQVGARELLREVRGPSGHYNPQPTRALVFGLGDSSCAQELRVRWPDGAEQSLGSVRADQSLRVKQSGEIAAQPLRRAP
jgi:hypothetical protein